MTTSTSISSSNTEAPEAVDVLYTNIGRGHPFYLDGIVESLPPASRGDITDVFALTQGAANGIWRAGRATYRLGSRAGGQNSLYSRLRRAGSYDTPGPLLRRAGRPISEHFANRRGPLIVAHPILVSLLRSHQKLVYQHGELVVPPECHIRGDHTILVPTRQAAERFLHAGTQRRKLIVTGLCIEPELAAEAAAMQAQRQQRYMTTATLTGGFFSSDAEPGAHTKRLVAAALSAVRRDGRVLLVAKQGGPFERRIRHAFEKCGLTLNTDAKQMPPSGALLQTYGNRAALNRITLQCFAHLDYFVSPSHERTNWAAGLGLPMFIVAPAIGTFAPRNREFLLAQGVAEVLTTLSEATRFGQRLEEQRKNGTLQMRSRSGWGQFPIDGFRTISEWLITSDKPDGGPPKGI